MRGLRSRRPFSRALVRMLLLLNPRISLYTTMMRYTMRAVTTAFTPSDRKKNAVTDGRYELGRGPLSATLLISRLSVVNMVTMMQS